MTKIALLNALLHDLHHDLCYVLVDNKQAHVKKNSYSGDFYVIVLVLLITHE